MSPDGRNNRPAAAVVALLLLFLLAANGCSTALVATPNLLLLPSRADTYAQTPEAQRKPEMDILYFTDRTIYQETKKGPIYGFGRDQDMTFGVATVKVFPPPTWDQLVADSLTQQRSRDYSLKLSKTEPLVTIPALTQKYAVHDGRLEVPDDVLAEYNGDVAKMQAVLTERLNQTDVKDVYLFVHGFNNTFGEICYRTATVWHFMGRQGVPVAYSWPAAYGGLFGYAYDRESGEFTVFHLKRTIKAIASCPAVQRIHIIAHSRGCDVAVSAIRELHLECRAKGQETAEVLKLQTLVLAAPDLDYDVFNQRFGAERVVNAVNRTVIYFSSDDMAIGFAKFLFSSPKRLGRLALQDFTQDTRKRLVELPRMEFINCPVSGFGSSHDYVFAHPAVLSDLILVVKENRPPGAANGRPLVPPEDGLWQIDNNYPLGKTPPPGTTRDCHW